MIDQITITDSTTREELIAHVNDLQEEVDKLIEKVKEKENEIEDLALTSEQEDRLAEAADLMAEQGKIFDTPYAKAKWMAGK